MKTKCRISLKLVGAIWPSLLALQQPDPATAQTVSRIAFNAPVAANKRTSYSQIFSMNPDGSGIVQLTAATNNALAPRWSPGQQYISFYRNQAIWVMEAKGEANGSRSFPIQTAGLSGSDWSPDGAMLAFAGVQTNLYLVAIDAATGQVGTPVLFRTGYYSDPSWSPDGSRIAFWGSDDGNVPIAIHVRNVATGGEYSFGTDLQSPYGNAHPQWSPDGTRIAFTGPITLTSTTRKGTTTTTYQEIFLANTDGSNITRVTFLNTSTYYPTWSPDGTTLAFRSDYGGSAIYKMVLGSNVLTPLYTGGNNPDWNP